MQIIDPELKPTSDGRLPHVYPDRSLCLHLAGEGHQDLLATHTIIPWTLDWLFYYELWLATGTWYGDGPAALNEDAQDALLHTFVLPDVGSAGARAA